MSEEQKLILDMLSEGKITVEEAQALLESIRREAPKSETRRDPVRESKSIIENIVESLRSGLSSLNLSFGDDRRIVLEEHHSGSFSSDMVELDLDVRNGSLRIEPSDDKNFHLEVIKKIVAGTREQAEELISGYKFAEYDGLRLKAGDTECRSLGNRVNVSLRLQLPAGHIYTGRVASKNGQIDINSIDAKGISVATVNGTVRMTKVTGSEVNVSTVNGSISLEGRLQHVEGRTTNGSISLVSMGEDSMINLKTVNGRIKVQLPHRDDIGFTVDARATSGNVRVEHGFLSDKFLTQRLGAGRKVEGATDNWDYAQHKISLYLRSVNGSISIQELE
jgi:DUF4097 and DUF4098 domain-containing protein YvlB